MASTAAVWLKRAVKGTVAFLLVRTGIAWILLARRLRDRTAVLMYHRVLPEEELDACPSTPGIVVGKRTFERQMACLRRLFTVLDPDSFVTALESGNRMPSRSVLVTFDDGWRDNHEHAAPILERYGIPAVIFLTAGSVGTRCGFWQERMVGAVRSLRHACAADPSIFPAVSGDPELAGLLPCLVKNEAAARRSIHALVASMKAAGRGERERFIDCIADLLPGGVVPELQGARFLDWREAAELQEGTVRFGSHGLTHRILTDPETEVARELGESKAILERELARPVELLAYPNGDHDGTAVELARQAGYRAAFTTRRGAVASGDDPWTLKRINIHQGAAGSVPQFLIRILGLW